MSISIYRLSIYAHVYTTYIGCIYIRMCVCVHVYIFITKDNTHDPGVWRPRSGSSAPAAHDTQASGGGMPAENLVFLQSLSSEDVHPHPAWAVA